MNQADEELNTLVLNKELDWRKYLALGMYVHVPFCSTTCDFCAFYQEKPSKKGISDYFSGLKLEFERFFPDRPLSTIFIGGGTPGLLSADQLSELCKMIGSLDHEVGIEWSIELAPSEINPEKLEVLRKGAPTSGEACIQFEQAFADYCGTKHARVVSNGTAALFLSLVALDIGPGDHILTTPLTWIATAAVL